MKYADATSLPAVRPVRVAAGARTPGRLIGGYAENSAQDHPVLKHDQLNRNGREDQLQGGMSFADRANLSPKNNKKRAAKAARQDDVPV
ncbi:hypothetical protein [Rhizobium sp. SGZ-381]|uniref:hypothetical protein n=1 Tax=Rhizobium sp. SGZ-381 TaxID=3342800 RepID=UPI003670D398